jgi:hypothetical protein
VVDARLVSVWTVDRYQVRVLVFTLEFQGLPGSSLLCDILCYTR